MAFPVGFGAFKPEDLDGDGIAMWQRYGKEWALCEGAVEMDQGMPEVDLRLARELTQGHKGFAFGRLELAASAWTAV